MLRWEDILQELPAASRKLGNEESSRWTFITQQEHPVVRRPWHAPHPCETAALMRLLLTSADADVSPGTANISQHTAGHHPMHGSNGLPDADAALQLPISMDTTCALLSGQPYGPNDLVTNHEGGCSSERALPDVKVQQVSSEVVSDDVSGTGERGLRYLRAWLSLVAPAVGLPVPIGFWQ